MNRVNQGRSSHTQGQQGPRCRGLRLAQAAFGFTAIASIAGIATIAIAANVTIAITANVACCRPA